MGKILCFGELLLRFSPQLGGEWIHQSSMPVFVGGAELNTATALARWKEDVGYCTALPDHYLSKEIVKHLQANNINTGTIHLQGDRIGTYYLPQGADLKNAGVIYDRAYSSFWKLKPGAIDWNKVLEGVSWFHLSAICPALNADVAAVCKEALRVASEKGITCSMDLNYRAKLWQYGKQPVDVMPDLVQYCNVVMGNIWAAEKMMGIAIETNLNGAKEAYVNQALITSQKIVQQFTSCNQVANTFRFDEGEGLNYYATLYKSGALYQAPEHRTESIVDKVGSGDTFMAGLIYGNQKHWTEQQIVDFAAAAAFNKLFIKGDATTTSVEEIQKGLITHE